ncbi:MbnP family copper-binding protein [Jannaschia marina]|uniref:MbnP family copper-binding protein n=1 Tax=Jannaschia marina TaxID=2741674 RepID=UPI001F177D99|nr:MbnP family copper-binding protein [Jannaschia marina]
MTTSFRTAALLVATSLTLPAAAHEFAGGDLFIGHPYTHPTPGVAPSGIVYLTIRNDGSEPDRLIGVDAPGFEGTSLHRTEMTDGIMRMLPQEDGIPVAPGETVALEPSGLHIMLEGLGGDPFELGEEIPVTLIFERAGRVDVVVNVDPRGEGAVDHSQHVMESTDAGTAHSEHGEPIKTAITETGHGDMAMRPIEVAFAAEVDGAPFACGETYTGLGSKGTAVRFSDYRVFVSDPKVIRSDGTEIAITLKEDIWQTGATALLDFEDGSATCTNGTAQLNTTLRGQVPDGEYDGLTFTLGVPFAVNHGDPTVAPSPLNLTSMFWNWRAGYRFVKIDMLPQDTEIEGWFLHLGSTMCPSEGRTDPPTGTCANPNRPTITLTGFDPDTGSVVIDPAPVVAGADLTVNAPETAAGCMSFPDDPDCTTVMPKFGLPYMGAPAEAQILISGR